VTATLADVRTDHRLATDFEKIFRDHHQLVYRTAYGVTGSAEDAEDILQTIFLRLLRREEAPDLGANAKAYFYRAAVNLSLNRLQQRRREVLSAGLGETMRATPSSEAEALEELHRQLYGAIAELDLDDAELLILRYVHNQSDAEIARLFGKSRVAIAVRLFRLRARLKQIMSRFMEGS
jgi:RNA polymerase sigma-70 factor (ECF subfamily)